MSLFDVAEQRDAAHDPVVGLDGRLEHQRRDVRQVGATRLLIDGTLVQLRLPAATLLHVDREDVHDRQLGVEHLGRLLHQSPVATIPPGTVQKQTVDVDACTQLCNEKHSKNVEPFYIVIHQGSLLPPLSHAACASMSTTTTTTTTTTTITRDRGDRMEWAQL